MTSPSELMSVPVSDEVRVRFLKLLRAELPADKANAVVPAGRVDAFLARAFKECHTAVPPWETGQTTADRVRYLSVGVVAQDLANRRKTLELRGGAQSALYRRIKWQLDIELAIADLADELASKNRVTRSPIAALLSRRRRPPRAS